MDRSVQDRARNVFARPGGGNTLSSLDLVAAPGDPHGRHHAAPRHPSSGSLGNRGAASLSDLQVSTYSESRYSPQQRAMWRVPPLSRLDGPGTRVAGGGWGE